MSGEKGGVLCLATKLLICDDNASDGLHLRRLIEAYGQKTGLSFQITLCTQREDILREIQRSELYEALFLDIYLESSLNGVELARLLRRQDSRIKLVFVSTSPLHALEAFGVNASQYLVKPVSCTALSQTLDLLLEARRDGDFIHVNCANQIVKIFLRDLMYTETQRHYQALYLASGATERARMTQAELRESLKGQRRFARVGASFLVNLDYVVRVASDQVELQGNRVIHVPRRALAELKRQYFDYYYEGEEASHESCPRN